MEIYNARAYFNGLNENSRKFSERKEVKGNIAVLGVSDAHTPEELGNGLTEIDAVNESEFRREIKKCRTRVVPMKRATILRHFETQLAKRYLVQPR